MMSVRRWLVLESEIYWAEIRMVNPRFSLPPMATMLTFLLACVGEGGVLTVQIQLESGVPLIDNQHLSFANSSPDARRKDFGSRSAMERACWLVNEHGRA